MKRAYLYVLVVFSLTKINYSQSFASDTLIIQQFSDTAKNYQAKNNSEEALYNYSKALNLCNQSLLDNSGVNQNAINWLLLKRGNLNLSMGLMLTSVYKFEEGIPYLLKASDDFEKLKNYNRLIKAFNAVSLAYHDFGDYKKGIEYSNLSLQTLNTHVTEVNPNLYWYCYNNFGINYDDNKQYELAIASHLKALPYGVSGSDSSYSYNNLGNTFKKLKQYGKAADYFKLSLRANDDPADVYHIATIRSNLVDIYRLTKSYQLANYHLDSALYYSEKSKSPEKLMDIYYYAYLVNYETSNFQNSTDFLKKYVSLKDSLFTVEKNNAVIHYQTKYETEKKEKENLFLTIENDRQRSKNQLLVLVAIGLSVLTALVVWFLMYRRKQAMMKRQAIVLNEIVLETEQHERERIARDLHDSVGQKLSVVKMQLSMKNADVASASGLLDTAIQDVRNVSHNLMSADLNKGLILAIDSLCEQLNLSSTKLKAYVNKTDSIWKLNLDKQHTLLIYRIVQEIVNNTIKYSEARNIHISMDCERNTLKLVLRDDGIGFDTHASETKTGLGIKNIKDRVSQLKGNLKLTSAPSRGTEYIITIPL